MKRVLSGLFVILSVAVCVHVRAEGPAQDTLKYYMHSLFDNFNQARISHSLGRKDVSDIYLRRMEESVIEARKYIPETKKDGTPIDKETFRRRLDTLVNMVSDLRAAVRYDEKVLTRRLPEEIFNMCVACHSEMRLGYLFRAPMRTTLFGEYMHRVSEHVDLARIYIEQSRVRRTEEEIRLIGYYLDLLEEAFPGEGPSGVIMDRKDFKRRVKDVREAADRIMARVSVERIGAVENLRKTLNGLCVACHEPERIK